MLKKILKISNVKTNVAKNEEKKDNENKDVDREQKVKTDIAKKEEKKDNENKDTNDESKEIDDSYIRDKLELLTLVLATYNPIVKYADYKKALREIKEKVKNLKFIRDSLIIFHRNKYNEDIKK